MATDAYDLNEAYRQTQSQIYNLQETILNSAKHSGSADERSARDFQIVADREPQTTKVRSTQVLEYVLNKYGSAPRESLGTLMYHPYRSGSFENNDDEKRLLDDPFAVSMPRPFLPALSEDSINKLITIRVFYEDLRDSFNHSNAPRAQNNEIWGCQVYTDDSEPLLVLRHCGLSLADFNGTSRTPANLDNQDFVQGAVPPDNAPFDLEMDLLILPRLEQYASVEQYGVLSRSWGVDAPTPHDGLSYGIYEIRIATRDTSTRNIDQSDQQQITLKW